LSDYCEIPEWYSGRWSIARKEHRCVECGAPIFRGEKYGSFSGKWDGKVSTYRQHLECEEACRFIRDFFQYGECIGFGELYEYEDEYIVNGPKDQRDKDFRSIMARVKWRRKKKRPLTWLKTREVLNEGLIRDRNGGGFSG